MQQLHGHSTLAYLRGATVVVIAASQFRAHVQLTERSRTSVPLVHLSKIGSLATCSGVVISWSQVQTEEGQSKGVKNGKALMGEREWRLVVDASIVGVSWASLLYSLMLPFGEETDPVLTVHAFSRITHTCYTTRFKFSQSVNRSTAHTKNLLLFQDSD